MHATSLRISLSALGLVSSYVAPRAYAQTIHWTDIGTSKVQRLDLNAGAGVPCGAFGFDFDRDVGWSDFGAFQLAHTGPL